MSYHLVTTLILFTNKSTQLKMSLLPSGELYIPFGIDYDEPYHCPIYYITKPTESEDHQDTTSNDTKLNGYVVKSSFFTSK